MDSAAEDRSEIVFFDVETTVPTRPGQRFAILEFGAILVCPRKLTELQFYSTLVRPANPSLISPISERCNGITAAAVATAPTFADIADTVYDLLHERIWAGHNIIRFDCVRIKDAFAEIDRPAPEPKGTIDSLVLLTQKFGRRAGNMKMATLASYFGLGQQTHRSLDDVRMNLEVLKYCATVLFLESSLPDIFTENCWVSPNAVTRSRSNGKPLPVRRESLLPASPASQADENHPTFSLPTSSSSSSEGADSHMADAFDLSSLCDEIRRESVQPDNDEKHIQDSPQTQTSSLAASSESCSSSAVVLELDDMLIPSISASLFPLFGSIQRIELLHNGSHFHVSCARLKVRFGISTKFADSAGRPKLNFVVDASSSLSNVLDACDSVAQKLSLESGSSSDWRPLVIRKEGFFNYPTLRLHIPTAVCGDVAIYATEIYQRESSGTVQRLLFSKFDAAELGTLFMPGTFVDAVFSLDAYDYQQSAGIRLVAKRLTIHSN